MDSATGETNRIIGYGHKMDSTLTVRALNITN